MKKPVKIGVGLIGLGTVGTGLVKAIRAQRGRIRERLGVDLALRRVAERNWRRRRDVRIPASMRCASAAELIDDPSVDIVVELIGGCDEAGDYIIEAIRRGKHVVTANKALLAERGRAIFSLAARRGVDLYYEASVCGGIPVIKALREAMASNRIHSILGIVNGTCNYILSRMSEEGIGFAEALGEAQRLGYAEADPTLDIDGVDSAHKLALIASIAAGSWVPFGRVYVEGIRRITALDIRYAREFDYAVKLLAICKIEDGKIEARVHPTLIPATHLLASVRGAYNAVCIGGNPVGEIVLYGAGAGRKPTSSAVLSDVIDIALNIRSGACGRIPPLAEHVKRKAVKRMGDIETQYYLRFSVIDRPGVLAGITGVLGGAQISIAAVLQTERRAGGIVPVVIMTHRARERNLRRALAAINGLPYIRARTVVIRVEDGT